MATALKDTIRQSKPGIVVSVQVSVADVRQAHGVKWIEKMSSHLA